MDIVMTSAGYKMICRCLVIFWIIYKYCKKNLTFIVCLICNNKAIMLS